MGRFLTPDPIGHEGGFNLYAYCDNDPVNQIDPEGTQGTTGSYLGDVGQVFLGYGDGLNPANMAKGTYGAWANYASRTVNALGSGYGAFSPAVGFAESAKDMVSGLYDTLTNWPSPRDFGRSWMTGSMLAAPALRGIPNPTPISVYGPYGAWADFTLFAIDDSRILGKVKDGNTITNPNIFRFDVGPVPSKGGKALPHIQSRHMKGGTKNHWPWGKK